MYAELIAHFLVSDRSEMRTIPPPRPVVVAAIIPVPGPPPDPYEGEPPAGGGLGAPVSTVTVSPTLTAPRPASTVRTSPCPVQSWVYRRWTASSDVTTYNADKKTPVGRIPAGSVIEGCQDPTGWTATFSGWVAP